MKILLIILSSWLLTGCILIPGSIGVIGEYGAVTVQPNPVIVDTYYTTPYNTGNTVYYSPQVIVPPPKSSYYDDYRPRPYYHHKPRPYYHHKPQPYYHHKPQPYYHHKPYYGPKPYYKKYKLQPY